MDQQLKQLSRNDIFALINKDAKAIPNACQYNNLCSNDIHRVQDEKVIWLKDLADHTPIWSRLKLNNCLDQPRDVSLNKIKNYEVEIPGRLISLFGSELQQALQQNKLIEKENFYLVACALALCSGLSYNIMEWSDKLLDNIFCKAIGIHHEILEKYNITDKEFRISHLNQVLQFQGIDYQLKSQQVATGFLYMPYGLNEFNLARALTWFFRYYQFGIIQCCKRFLAFGFTLDSEYGFFMYDCQSQGFPLFKEGQFNSYILRANHLQVLLYCMTITLNVTMERVKFFIYNVDVSIIDPLEHKTLKKEIYVPIIAGSDVKKIIESKVDSGLNKKPSSKTEIVPKPSTKTLKRKSKNSVMDITSNKSYKLNQQTEIVSKQSTKTLKENSKNSVINITSNKSYKLDQHYSDKEIILNAKTTIKAASKIFRAVSEKPTKEAQKSKLFQMPLKKEIGLSTKTLASPKNLAKMPVKPSLPTKPTFVKNIIESPKKIPIDPNKRYYIIAVPKKSQTVFTALPPKRDATTLNKESAVQTVKVNIQRLSTINPPPNDNSPSLKVLQKNELEIDLEKSDSTVTLTNDMEYKEEDNTNGNPMGLKVYLVDNRKKCGLIK